MYFSTMIKLFVLLSLLNVVLITSQDCGNSKEVVCYWGSWSIYRPGKGGFSSDSIDPTLCTTIIYTFAGLDLSFRITSLDYNADIALGGFSNMTALKEINPCLKTTLAIGGWNAGSQPYSLVAYSDIDRQNFADSVVKFLIYYGFDGLDLDWEYPTTRGGLPDDKENFVSLLGAVKQRFKPWGLMLTIAVPMDESLVHEAYDVVAIKDLVDYVHLMAYDYTSSDSPITGLNSPISAMKNSVQLWLDSGLPANKLILGIPAYGRAFVLEDPSNYGIGAQTSKTYTLEGSYTRQAGFMGYYELLEQVVTYAKYCDIHEDDGNKWAVCNDDEWYSYDDEDTVQQKVEYALEQDLGGVMLWSVDTDDFRGDFGEAYPLLRKINNLLETGKSRHAPKRVRYPKTTS